MPSAKSKVKALSLLTITLMATTSFALAGPSGPGLQLDQNESIVIENDTLFPVSDKVHDFLKAAYKQLGDHDKSGAASSVRKAAGSLRAQAQTLEPTPAARATSAAAKLEAVAARIEGNEATQHELQLAIERAYLADRAPRWVKTEEVAVFNLLELPGEHMAEALKNFKAGNFDDAAFDLRQAVAYMEVTEGANVESQALTRLAYQATLDAENRPTVSQFENIIIGASKAYADNQTDQAALTGNLTKIKRHLQSAVDSARVVDDNQFAPGLKNAIHQAESAMAAEYHATREELQKAAHDLRDAI